ncbi:hypothetical protein TWF696_008253 [Orbilia brochopaga]|uniref:Alginate lyase domain-containing protein n=1 Tax=Orbilia brochopaga TaxID=3140254 RepID=A0AAV9UIP8_9PEZI
MWSKTISILPSHKERLLESNAPDRPYPTNPDNDTSDATGGFFTRLSSRKPILIAGGLIFCFILVAFILNLAPIIQDDDSTDTIVYSDLPKNDHSDRPQSPLETQLDDEDDDPTSEPPSLALVQLTAEARGKSNISYTTFLEAARLEREYAIALLLDEADIALANREVYSVTLKDATQIAPSKNIHDYVSLRKYWWPNPDTEDGLPYVRIDGVTNPEIYTVADHDLLRAMMADVHTMGMAYYFTGGVKKEYLHKSAMRLREWFLDKKTYMTPHLNYGSLRRGETHGMQYGLLDMYPIFRMFDALHYLKQDAEWPTELIPELQRWFQKYVKWLETSKIGRGERAARNNHGSYFDVQIIGIYIFLGRMADARAVARKALNRIDSQVRADGSQPEELARTMSFHYSVFNLQAFMTLARWGDELDVDIWRYEGPDGQSIRKATDFLLQYALKDGKGWPVPNINGFTPGLVDFLKCLKIAWIVYGDERYLEGIRYLEPKVNRWMAAGEAKTISTYFCDMSMLLEAGRHGTGFMWHWCLASLEEPGRVHSVYG